MPLCKKLESNLRFLLKNPLDVLKYNILLGNLGLSKNANSLVTGLVTRELLPLVQCFDVLLVGVLVYEGHGTSGDTLVHHSLQESLDLNRVDVNGLLVDWLVEEVEDCLLVAIFNVEFNQGCLDQGDHVFQKRVALSVRLDVSFKRTEF